MHVIEILCAGFVGRFDVRDWQFPTLAVQTRMFRELYELYSKASCDLISARPRGVTIDIESSKLSENAMSLPTSCCSTDFRRHDPN